MSNHFNLKRVARAYLSPYRGCRSLRDRVTVAESMLRGYAVAYVTIHPWWRLTGVSTLEIVRVLATGVGVL